MRNRTLGYYDSRNDVRLSLGKGDLRAAFGRTPVEVRVEVLEDGIVLTDPREAAWTNRDD